MIASPFPKQHYKVYFFFTNSCRCGVQMLFDFHCKSLGLVSCTAKVGIPPVGFLGCKHLNLCSFLASFLLFDFPIWVGLLSNLGGYLKSFLQNQHNNWNSVWWLQLFNLAVSDIEQARECSEDAGKLCKFGPKPLTELYDQISQRSQVSRIAHTAAVWESESVKQMFPHLTIIIITVHRWMLWPTCSKSWHPSPRPFCIMQLPPPIAPPPHTRSSCVPAIQTQKNVAFCHFDF